MLSVLRKSKLSSFRQVYACNHTLGFPWFNIRGKGGDMLLTTDKGVTLVATGQPVLGDVTDLVWEHEIGAHLEKSVAQLDAECMVQLAAVMSTRIVQAQEIKSPLVCYGVLLNIAQLKIVVTMCEMEFNEVTTTKVIV